MNPLDLLYARQCELCGCALESPDRCLCWDCRARLPFIVEPFCRRCGDPVFGAVTDSYTCGWCRRHPPAFDAARSALRFRDAVRTCLHSLKYEQGLYWLDDLVQLLAACVRVHYGSIPMDAILPVPLHATRTRYRTYNQAALLARGLSREVGVPCVAAGLRRVRSTPSQTNLNAMQRRRNVEGAFTARHPDWIRGRSLLLVDDMMTTGATADACARALKQAGAVRVLVATVGRG